MKKMRNASAAILLLMGLYLGVAVSSCLTSCVQIEPIETHEVGNFSCTLPDESGYVLEGEVRFDGISLGRDGESLLTGTWRLCNDDSGVTCVITTATSTSS